MSRIVTFCLSSVIVATLVPVAVEARPVIQSILPTGITPNPASRVITVITDITNQDKPIGLWIGPNAKDNCKNLATPPDLGGLSVVAPPAPPTYVSAPILLTAYEGTGQQAEKGDLVCVGPPYLSPTYTVPVPVCHCMRAQ